MSGPSEPADAGPEDERGGAAHGERVPAPLEGHELQREDQGAHGQLQPANPLPEDKTEGVRLPGRPASWPISCALHTLSTFAFLTVGGRVVSGVCDGSESTSSVLDHERMLFNQSP